MIPPIEAIVDDLLGGRVTKQQAITYLLVHAEEAGRDFRDDCAIAALKGIVDNDGYTPEMAAREAYEVADAMLMVRAEKG